MSKGNNNKGCLKKQKKNTMIKNYNQMQVENTQMTDKTVNVSLNWWAIKKIQY